MDDKKVIQEIKKKNDKLSADFKLVLEKLRYDDQASQIKYKLWQKDLDNLKGATKKKYQLIYSLFISLLRPELRTNSSISDMLSALLLADDEKIDPSLLKGLQELVTRAPDIEDNLTFHDPHEQQLVHQQQQQLDLLKHLLEERDEEIKNERMENERKFQSLQEQLDELKRQEGQPRLSSFFNQQQNKEGYRDDAFSDDVRTATDDGSFSVEEEEHHFLPADTYSYFAVANYFTKGRYCVMPTHGFSLAFSATTIQLLTLSIFVMDVFDFEGDIFLSVPAGVGIQVRVSQVVALLISCWNQDEIRASFNTLQIGYMKEKVRVISPTSTRWKWHFSIFIRLFIGVFSLVVTFVLIFNSDNVRDVMLDFAAVTFVSELDNGAFILASWGYMGREVKELTNRIKTIPVYDYDAPNRGYFTKKKLPRLFSLLFIIIVVVGLWAGLTTMQDRGEFMEKAIFVQFGDDFSPALAAFSGIYETELDDSIDGMRVNYIEVGRKSDGKFAYCSRSGTWMFQYDAAADGQSFDPCWHRAMSMETESYDITETSDLAWFLLDEELSLDLPLQHFVVIGQSDYFGKSCRRDDECGDRMYCDENSQTCACQDGLFGLNCEFHEPCQTLEIDSRDPNGFFGTRSWSRRFRSIQKDDDGEDGYHSPIQVYGKPVYIGDMSIEGIFDVMVFTGRRWILTDSIHIDDYSYNSSSSTFDDDNVSDLAKRDLAEFLSNNFHAYWSNYTFYFASEPVDVGTPTDSATPVGLNWFRLETTGTRGVSLLSGDKIWQGTMSIEANLICTVCNNETNPCFYGAHCNADGACECTTGSSGSICQIPPDNNGNCDVFFNTPEFGFDGGDCCQETCRSTEEYDCGKGMIEDAGISAYGFIGYPNCQDPRFKSKLSGSTTLYEIVERGFLRCGGEFYPAFLERTDDGGIGGFEGTLCKSIAAAILGDPEAIEIVETNSKERWKGLTDGSFDVLLRRTTHTAERDVYQGGAKLGFSFVPIPTFYDGLRYGGIPPFSECADNLDFESSACADLKVCVLRDSTWYQVTEDLFPASMVLEVESIQAEVDGLEAGICNVIAGEISLVAEFSVRDRGFTGPSYNLGNNIYSKEPLCAVTRQDDGVFSKFVTWVFEALIQAEESGVTQSTAVASIATTDVFGDKFQNMFQNAVAANGNFGEIYEKNLEDKIPRGGLNTINTGTSGLIYSFPFGAIDTPGEGPTAGGTLETIRKRGILNCGLKKHPGFGDLDPETGVWQGFEVDMCRGIAAALFNGSPNVNFIPLTSGERFTALAAGTVDIMNCATTHTLAREVKEVTTGQGFDFSPPTFYDGLGFAGRTPYVSCAEIRVFDNNREDCVNTRICVPQATTTLDAMRGSLNIPEENIVVTTNQEDLYSKYIAGDCNVIAGESLQIMKSTLQEYGLPEDEEYKVGEFKYSKEPLAIVSRSDDAQFSDFLRWIVYGFFYAEEAGITRDEYYDMPGSNYLFGGALSAMWQHSVEAVGNYGEIFERNFKGKLERGGPNTLNRNGPQFLAIPGVKINKE